MGRWTRQDLGRRRGWLTATVVATALLAAGCGLGESPALTDENQVVAALAALGGQSGRAVLSASIEVDEGELRALLREDEDLLDLLTDGLDLPAEPTDADGLLTQLEDATAELARHRLLLGVGDDRSVRYAVETDDTVWVDLRQRTDFDASAEQLLDPVELTVQALFDAPSFVELFAIDDDIATGFDDAGTTLAEARAGMIADRPDTAPLFDLAAAGLDGELVEVGGQLDPRAWIDTFTTAFGGTADADQLVADIEELVDENRGLLQQSDVAPDQAIRRLFSFDGYRTDGAITVVDLTIEVQDGVRWLLDTVEAQVLAGDLLPPGEKDVLRADIDEARTALAEAPVRLEDVGTLRFGPDGVLQQLRVDVLDIALQMASAIEDDDEELATVATAVGRLERSGVFVTLDLADVGQVPTVLGEPAAAVSWDQLRSIVASSLPEGAFDLMPDPMGDGVDQDGSVAPLDGLDGLRSGLEPDQLSVGDCFLDEALSAPPGQGELVACSDPHDNEVYAMVEAAPPGSPVDPVAIESAYEGCLTSFEEYVGTPYATSALSISTIAPTADQWAAGTTAVACYLYSFEVEVGSAAGSGR